MPYPKAEKTFVTIEQAIMEEIQRIVTEKIGMVATPGQDYLAFREHFQTSMHWVFVSPGLEEKGAGWAQEWVDDYLCRPIKEKLCIGGLRIRFMTMEEAHDSDYIRYVEE